MKCMKCMQVSVACQTPRFSFEIFRLSAVTQEFINQKRTTCGNALFEESEGVAVALLPNLRVM